MDDFEDENIRRFGILVAVEMDAVFQVLGQPEDEEEVSGFSVYHFTWHGDQLFVIHSGAGQLAAAAATQILILVFQVEAVLNYGVVGGLTKKMKVARCCVVDKVIHYDYDVSKIDHVPVGQYPDMDSPYMYTTRAFYDAARECFPDIKSVTCASGDQFVDGKKNKKHLRKKTHADICDMEAAAIVRTCARTNVPCLLLKTVSDALEGGAEEFHNNLVETSVTCLEMLLKIVSRETTESEEPDSFLN